MVSQALLSLLAVLVVTVDITPGVMVDILPAVQVLVLLLLLQWVAGQVLPLVVASADFPHQAGLRLSGACSRRRVEACDNFIGQVREFVEASMISRVELDLLLYISFLTLFKARALPFRTMQLSFGE